MTLSADEFIRRFLLHVLPRGFHRIRYYGFLGNRHRKEKLAHCRQLLAGLLQRKALPSSRHQRITVIDTRGSRAALSGNARFVIAAA